MQLLNQLQNCSNILKFWQNTETNEGQRDAVEPGHRRYGPDRDSAEEERLFELLQKA